MKKKNVHRKRRPGDAPTPIDNFDRTGRTVSPLKFSSKSASAEKPPRQTSKCFPKAAIDGNKGAGQRFSDSLRKELSSSCLPFDM